MGLIFNNDAIDGRVPVVLTVLGVIGWIGWIVSEIMALSGCQYNGVLHFVIQKCHCLGGRQIHFQVTIQDIDVETPTMVIV